MHIKHLVFDNDGVNIDSEDVAMQVMDDVGYDLVKKYNPAADLERGYIYKTYPGTSTDRIVDALIKKFDLPAVLIRQDYDIAEGQDIAEVLADRITIETNARFQTDLKAIPGMSATLRQLRMAYGQENIALATTSRADRMDISLQCAAEPETGENAGLAGFFPEGQKRRSGYGHDNKYVEAFGALGWNPAESAVIEDSLSGVKKAKAYSPDVRVVGTVAARFYTDKNAQAKALLDAGASIVITNVRDLPASLAWLGSGMKPEDKPDFMGTTYAMPHFPAAPQIAIRLQNI